MRRSLLAVAVVLLVGLSGCAAITGTDDGDGPPGISDDELADTETLVTAHVETLGETGYSHELRIDQTRLDDGERVDVAREQRTNVAPEASEYEFQLINSGDVSSRFMVWGNQSVEYQSIEAGDDRQFRRSEPTSAAALAGVRVIEPHLTAPYEVTAREERDGIDVVRLEATSEPTESGAFPQRAENIGNYDAELVVDVDGRIQSLVVSAEYEIDGEDAEYELAFDVTALEDPGVERPGWVEDLES